MSQVKMNGVLEQSLFTLEQHEGQYETWPLETHLFKAEQNTGKTVPGFVLEAQYRYNDLYLLVTSWDCPFEESYEFLLLSEDLHVISKKRLGWWYSTVNLEHHEPISDKTILFRCSGGLNVVITIEPAPFWRGRARLALRINSMVPRRKS